jgi:hypothetical protein
MEAASSSSALPAAGSEVRRRPPEEFKLRRKTLETVLEQCQRALEMMREEGGLEEPDDAADLLEEEGGEAGGDGRDDEGAQPPPPSDADYETDEVRRRSRRLCFQLASFAVDWESGGSGIGGLIDRCFTWQLYTHIYHDMLMRKTLVS